jgi:carbamoyltransferase
MIIVGINKSSHNASVVLMKDNDIIFHIESERLSHVKYDRFPFNAMNKIKEYVDHVDIIALAGFAESRQYDELKLEDVYKAFILGLHKTFNDNSDNMKTYDFGNQHHATHAAISFYNSGFDEALCVVKDGAGSVIKFESKEDPLNMVGRESSSFFTSRYPEKFLLIKQHITTPHKLEKDQSIKWIDDSVYENNSFLSFLFMHKEDIYSEVL